MKEEKRYSANPFVAGMVIPINKKQVRLSRLGKNDNVLVNQETGELKGTHVATYRKVDSEKFVKLFTQNIALTFQLKSAGIKAFNLLLWSLQHKGLEKDLIPLDKYVLADFIKYHQANLKISLPTLWRGLSELEGAQIVAKAQRKGWYYINPNFCFNGDRVAFTTIIERDEWKEDQQELPINDGF